MLFQFIVSKFGKQFVFINYGKVYLLINKTKIVLHPVILFMTTKYVVSDPHRCPSRKNGNIIFPGVLTLLILFNFIEPSTNSKTDIEGCLNFKEIFNVISLLSQVNVSMI